MCGSVSFSITRTINLSLPPPTRAVHPVSLFLPRYHPLILKDNLQLRAQRFALPLPFKWPSNNVRLLRRGWIREPRSETLNWVKTSPVTGSPGADESTVGWEKFWRETLRTDGQHGHQFSVFSCLIFYFWQYEPSAGICYWYKQRQNLSKKTIKSRKMPSFHHDGLLIKCTLSVKLNRQESN